MLVLSARALPASDRPGITSATDGVPGVSAGFSITVMSCASVVRGGTVATASHVFTSDVGFAAGRIVAIGPDLATAAQEVDARGRHVLL